MTNNIKNEWVSSSPTINTYKSTYEAVRRILCDVKAFDPGNKDVIEKCMWISAMAEIMGDVPMNAASIACENNSLRKGTALVREVFPRKRSWNKLFGERNMDILLYAMVYEGICTISRDADDFDVYGQISDEEVEKCEWILAIWEVINDILQKYVNPILIDANAIFNWTDFYKNYYFE